MKTLNKGIIGKKIGMTMFIDEAGDALPVTVVQVLENRIVQKKDLAKDGYAAVKIGLNESVETKLSKPDRGQYKGVDKFYRQNVEMRLKDADKLNLGDELAFDVFQPNEKICVQGITKGRGFAGAVKRWNFTIGPLTHGSKHHRRSGSNGAGTGQGKVWKGQKFPGHYGCETVTIKNLKVVKIISEQKLMLIKGAVPGANGSLVKIYN